LKALKRLTGDVEFRIIAFCVLGLGTMQLIQKALTFDDVLLVPAPSAILPRDVSLQTRLTLDITLNLPLLSADMDTVTEGRLAIALAQEGGIGIIHKNLTPAQQAAEVAKVKRYESGVLKDPITINPNMTVRDVLALTRQHRISGLPVLDKSGKVVGIVTNRDLRFEDNLDQAVRQIMTPKKKLVTVREGGSIEEAKALMHKHRIERVLVVDDEFQLHGLITVKDILKATEHPNASKDPSGRLRAGAAVGVGAGTEERVELLAEAGVDVIVVDTAHGHSQGVLDRVQWVKIPEEEWGTARGLSRDKLNIVYCYSHVCHLGAKAALEFAIQGYPVMEMDGGFQGWKDNHLDTEAGGAYGRRSSRATDTLSTTH